jgi:hypothetical protein
MGTYRWVTGTYRWVTGTYRWVTGTYRWVIGTCRWSQRGCARTTRSLDSARASNAREGRGTERSEGVRRLGRREVGVSCGRPLGRAVASFLLIPRPVTLGEPDHGDALGDAGQWPSIAASFFPASRPVTLGESDYRDVPGEPNHSETSDGTDHEDALGDAGQWPSVVASSSLTSQPVTLGESTTAKPLVT